MQLHWDGNQRKMEERNKNASFGTGAFPPTIDLRALGRIEDWLIDKAPPEYPFPDRQEPWRAQGEKIYGAILRQLSRTKRARLQPATPVGKVTPIATVGTDRHRLDSFTPELATTLSILYAGLSVALQPFPQDLWLRQLAARWHLAARALSAQRLRPDPARSAQPERGTAADFLSRLRCLRSGKARLRF